MLAEINAGLGSLKAASEILKGWNAVANMVAINEVKISLQGHIFDAREALSAAQDAQASALKRIAELEQQIVQFKDWQAEKSRYHLQPIDIGAFAYVMKPGMDAGEPPHWLCTNCFGKGHKSFLQSKGQDRNPAGGKANTATYGCDVCKATIRVYYGRNPSTPWVPPVSVQP